MIKFNRTVYVHKDWLEDAETRANHNGWIITNQKPTDRPNIFKIWLLYVGNIQR